MQTNLDRRSLRPIPIICHLLDPPPSFSLPTTFNGNKQREIEKRGFVSPMDGVIDWQNCAKALIQYDAHNQLTLRENATTTIPNLR
jgi:hypothetical protein